MDVPTLVCGCGMRIKAPGAKPGGVGRCPSCGGRLEVPQALSVPDEPAPEIALADPEDGFGPHREIVLTPARTTESKPKGKRKRRREVVGPKGGRPPMADGFLPVLQKPETSWLTSFLYPLRGAESMGVVAAIGFIAWIFLTLVPEYCLQAMADAESMGAGLIGMLFVWLAVIPIGFLGPPVLFYWLQYLGRVLVSSATGDCAPPRLPDRNFDGFLNGLSPWFIWLVLGLGLGSMPALWQAFPDGRFAGGVPWSSLMLGLAALPYVLAALMLSFLHDDSMAAMPWGVLLALVRLGLSFLILAGLVTMALGFAGGCFALALTMRRYAFWPYLPVCLVCWVIFLWIQVAIMRLLGMYYFHHRDTLRWHRAHPRWGVRWRL